jgi:hypothetical protein
MFFNRVNGKCQLYGKSQTNSVFTRRDSMQRKETFGNLVHLSILVIVSVVIMVIVGCSSLKTEDVLRDSGECEKGDSLEVKVMSFNIAGDCQDYCQ